MPPHHGVAMSLCPLDYRYGRDSVKDIWSDEGRHARLLDVERALIWAHKELGRVTEEDYAAVAAVADPRIVTKERVAEIEDETKHDIMALTRAMSEAAGDAGWCIHLGATSNDIVDTAVALQMRDSISKQVESIQQLMGTLCDLAERERDTVMLGRTHGQAATPITFGLKVAVWVDEFRRHLIRLVQMTPRVCVGKFLGAVGTGAAQGDKARELQALILTHLNLGVPLVTTQVVGRDRYIEWVSWMANVATSVEKILQEVRNLQRSEIAEVAEFFSFGTNDLTQMTMGMSRDDSGSFLPNYEEQEIVTNNPFAVIDQTGVGQLMEIAVTKGRSTRKNIKLGICGEHGGEPSSVKFCYGLGLNYVSCSPFRVPVARLAAAQAALA